MGLKDSSKLGSKDSKLRPKDTKLKLASLRLDTSLLQKTKTTISPTLPTKATIYYYSNITHERM